MANGTVVAYGSNVLESPTANTTSGTGYLGGGQMQITSGNAVFEADDIVVIDVENLTATGEIDGNSRIVGITVYDNTTDYISGTPLYTYTPMNPGQYANIQSDVSGLGDNYLRFNSNILVSADAGAPTLTQLIVAAGEDLVGGLQSGPITLNRFTDNDYDASGTIDAGTVEAANGAYNTQNNQLVVICFVRGTLIDTPMGRIAIEDLKAGDEVTTLDNGAMPIRWIGQRTVPATGDLAPILIRRGALGNIRDLKVSPQHRMFVRDAMAELYCGEPEVLVAAKHLVNGDTICRVPGGEVEYFHIMLDNHQILLAEGCGAESLYPGRTAMSSLTDDARDEVLSLFPELSVSAKSYGHLARYQLNKGEAAVICNYS
ncbi:Hint domain-containing protein [Actibacterium lipolyticum]|uniref:Hedgehog/Intein (Hint) domain-containing protein n=1 Tax=Actibacterium lipolyticum TaxID=1524263 RepID=A0A238KKJ7_9RHOB|nr:Hint domain-containing protein [Actibacterium lipolyticum]SMX43250.1 hypothetical protein COL8621_02253 [Actibacterium lipolyticum]